MEDTYYLKGERKTWFWVSAGLLLLVFILPNLFAFINGLIMSRADSLFELMNTPYNLLTGIAELVSTAAWLIILLAYGLNNRIKVFKIMFLILAAAQVLSAIHAVTSLEPILSEGSYAPVIRVITAVLFFSRQAIWIAFMVIVLAHSKSNKPLKTSAIIVIIVQVLRFVWGGRMAVSDPAGVKFNGDADRRVVIHSHESIFNGVDDQLFPCNGVI